MDKKRFIVISNIVIVFIIAIVISIIYYNGKYQVSFNTGTHEIIMSQYVSKNSKVVEPDIPSKDGYVFVEWQLDGKKYDFNENVESNLDLTAKWVKENYITVNYQTNTDLYIEPSKVLSGSTLENLPNSYKEGYEFKGWYLNGELYDNRGVYSDVVLCAQYKNDKIDTTYKIGDKVKIIGKYSKSSNSKSSKSKKAIGWEREIIDILDDSENPYVVGNEKGITGYFKASSIEVIK